MTTSPAEDEKEFKEHMLIGHNNRRSRHNAAALNYSSELEEQAQLWANKLARQAYISYSEISGIGENITFFPADIDPETVVEHWYSEHEKYEYETPGWQTGTNYFTQVIWKATKEIGIGCAIVKKSTESNEDASSCSNGAQNSTSIVSCNGRISEDGEKVIVAFYRPAGNNNRAGQFAVNVIKP